MLLGKKQGFWGLLGTTRLGRARDKGEWGKKTNWPHADRDHSPLSVEGCGHGDLARPHAAPPAPGCCSLFWGGNAPFAPRWPHTAFGEHGAAEGLAPAPLGRQRRRAEVSRSGSEVPKEPCRTAGIPAPRFLRPLPPLP